MYAIRSYYAPGDSDSCGTPAPAHGLADAVPLCLRTPCPYWDRSSSSSASACCSASGWAAGSLPIAGAAPDAASPTSSPLSYLPQLRWRSTTPLSFRLRPPHRPASWLLCRITSYNVCYTKLLRRSAGSRRSRGERPARRRPPPGSMRGRTARGRRGSSGPT